jgi:methyl-accepting chemotaxis protein
MIGLLSKSIRLQVLAILIAGVGVLITVFVIGIQGKNQIIGSYQSLLNDELSTLETISNLNIDFKTQVQEWKNTLLRGHDPEQLEKYWQRFIEHSIDIPQRVDNVLAETTDPELTELLTRFQSVYPGMIASYKDGYEYFIGSGYDHKAADTSVRGIDREPSKLLVEAVALVDAKTKSAGQQLLDESVVKSLVSAILIVLSSLATLLFITIMFEKRIIKPIHKINTLSKHLASGDFTHPMSIDREDQIGQLSQNVELIRTDLGKLINEILVNMEQLGRFIGDTFTQLHTISSEVDESHVRSLALQKFIQQVNDSSSTLLTSGNENENFIEQTAASMQEEIKQ